MISEIVEGMEHLNALDKDSKKALTKGARITLGATMFIGGLTMSIAGGLAVASFFKDEEIQSRKTTPDMDDDI